MGSNRTKAGLRIPVRSRPVVTANGSVRNNTLGIPAGVRRVTTVLSVAHDWAQAIWDSASWLRSIDRHRPAGRLAAPIKDCSARDHA